VVVVFCMLSFLLGSQGLDGLFQSRQDAAFGHVDRAWRQARLFGRLTS